MKAMVYTAPLTLEVLEVEDPIPESDEVVIEVMAVGICGSELEGFANKSPFRVPPLIMGHEFAGIRVDTGERVVVNPVVSCHVCDLCLRGLGNICRVRKIIGIQRPGGFAERVSVPKSNCYPLPDNVSNEASAVIEPLSNAIHAVRLAQAYDALPLRVGVIGAGAIGFLTALTARDRGIPFVAISDLSPERRRLAALSGASMVCEKLDGEFDIVFDAVGTSSTRSSSLELLRPGGTAVWIGLHGSDPGFDGLAFIRKENRVLGAFCYQDQDFRAAIDRASSLDTDWVSTHYLDDGVGIFQSLVNGNVDSVKSVLLPRRSGSDSKNSNISSATGAFE